jgi:GDP-mannose 6-dehydrogenase
MNVSVFGLGRVGCVPAGCLARAGHHVCGVDVNPEKVALVNAGRAPLVEPGLADLLAKVVGVRRLRATSDPAEALCRAPCRTGLRRYVDACAAVL